jgi:hypothetical protein
MIWFGDEVTPGASLAFGSESIFGDELVEPPLQGALGESKGGNCQQLFNGRAGRARRDDAEQMIEFVGWNLKWHDLRLKWHDCFRIMPKPPLLWHDYPNHASKISNFPKIMPLKASIFWNGSVCISFRLGTGGGMRPLCGA